MNGYPPPWKICADCCVNKASRMWSHEFGWDELCENCYQKRSVAIADAALGSGFSDSNTNVDTARRQAVTGESRGPIQSKSMTADELRAHFEDICTQRQKRCPHGQRDKPERCVSCVLDEGASVLACNQMLVLGVDDARVDAYLNTTAAHGGRQEAPHPADMDLPDEVIQNGVNLRVIRQAYDWDIDIDGEVHGLTAGDQGFEPTGIKLEPRSLQALADMVPADGEKHVLRCVRCELPAAGAETPAQWQDIKTAPSGTMILVCSMSATIRARDWCWVDWLVGGRLMLHPAQSATHWMPLPAAPSASQPTTEQK